MASFTALLLVNFGETQGDKRLFEELPRLDRRSIGVVFFSFRLGTTLCGVAGPGRGANELGRLISKGLLDSSGLGLEARVSARGGTLRAPGAAAPAPPGRCTGGLKGSSYRACAANQPQTETNPAMIPAIGIPSNPRNARAPQSSNELAARHATNKYTIMLSWSGSLDDSRVLYYIISFLFYFYTISFILKTVVLTSFNRS
jgi:hypothetical protein